MSKFLPKFLKNSIDFKALSRKKKKKLAYRLMVFSPLGLIIPIVPGLLMFFTGARILLKLNRGSN